MADLEANALKDAGIVATLRRLEIIVRLAGVLLVTIALAGCFGDGPVDELYVRNDGVDEWMIRIPIPYEGYDGLFWVSRIMPGADGVAGRWAKEPAADAQIEVLGADCGLVAAFRPAAGQAHIVPQAPGLEVVITRWGSNVSRWNTAEIVLTEECGGSPGFQ
jgi:hypothetical protein